jgi:iron(II)-dependent oxidoreductase
VDLTQHIIDELEGARARTFALLDPMPDEVLVAQHSELMSPLVWDLAHIGHYEELWLLRTLAGASPTDVRFDDVYDAFRHPRAERPTLDILGPREARDYVTGVRKQVLDVLTERGVDGTDPLLLDGFVYGMVIRHEHQHNETMLATTQLMRDFAHPDAGDEPATARVDPLREADQVLVEAGPFVMGTDSDPWAYDNERPAHVVDLPAFRIDTTAVTNEAYLAFVDAGGYEHPEWWSADGWAWRQRAELTAPLFWSRDKGRRWQRLRFGRREELPPCEPVQHVCWYEADAYARWRGRRLPTEAEWEKAASWDPNHGDGVKVDGLGPDGAGVGGLFNVEERFGPDEVGAHPHGASPWGCVDMIGGVWEWTSTSFDGYPGFASFPYREYSEVFFGDDYKVLRGGSWATHRSAVSSTFRNWDYPIRRQIFAGFRCASDA